MSVNVNLGYLVNAIKEEQGKIRSVSPPSLATISIDQALEDSWRLIAICCKRWCDPEFSCDFESQE